jgi:hypothetical protein
MIWPWRKHDDTPPPPPFDPDGAHDEAVAAREEAERHLREAADSWPEVHRTAASLRRLRTQNHFTETIEAIVRKGAL